VAAVSERKGEPPLGKNLVGAHQPFDGSLDGRSPGRVEPEELGNRGNVVLPAEPDQREPVAHQKAVAQVGGRHRVAAPGGTPVEITHHRLATPVGDLHQGGTVAPPRIDRAQDVEIGRVLHPAVLAPGRLVQIDDPCISRVGRIER
jgi:hypothetical protein